MGGPELGEKRVAIRIDEVHHTYSARQALAGISLEVRQGEMFGLLGPNGGGLSASFRPPSVPDDTGYLAYFYPGIIVLVMLFTAIFATIAVVEDRREGFLQGVLVAPVSR